MRIERLSWAVGSVWWLFLAFAVSGAEPLVSNRPELASARLAAEVRDKGWLAFGARSEQGDWDLFVCRPDGSSVASLTHTAEYNEFSPQFSRDGRKLLYRRVLKSEKIDNNRHGEQGSLVLANSDGSDPQVLGEQGEFPWASWSPDGRQIACLSIKGIFFVNLATREVVRTLPRKGFFQQTTWSPDGLWLCGVANSFGTGWSTARMRIDSGEVNPVNTVDCCTPDWFPNCRQLIFSWRPRGQKANHGQGWTQLWRADVQGQVRQLVYGEDGRHVYGGHISPDGQYVLFTGNKQEDGDPANAGAPMALMRLSDGPIIGGESADLRALHPGTKAGPILSLPTGWEPCWTASQLFAQTSIPAAERALRPLSNAPADAEAKNELARELHTEGWLVFSAKTPRGDWDLFEMRPDGSDRRNISETPDFNEAGARFSPDGSRLLYYRMPKSEPVDNNSYGTYELVIAQADGTQPVSYGSALPWASWGPDGRELACLTPKGIQIIDVASRAVLRQFPRKGIVSQLIWSPDGQRFIGTANALGPYWNIGCLDPQTGQIRAVSETERYNCTPDWLPDSKRVVYARGIIPQQEGRAELWVANIDGSERRRIYAEKGRHIYGACASPDGRFVMFTRSIEDLGKVLETEMAVIRWPNAASNAEGGSSGSPPPNGSVQRVDLGQGWEPHWTLAVMPGSTNLPAR